MAFIPIEDEIRREEIWREACMIWEDTDRDSCSLKIADLLNIGITRDWRIIKSCGLYRRHMYEAFWAAYSNIMNPSRQFSLKSRREYMVGLVNGK